MNETNRFDPEYTWIVRTIANAFKVYITMFHLIIYDNTMRMELEDPRKFFLLLTQLFRNF